MKQLNRSSIILTIKVIKFGGFEDLGNTDGFSKVGSKAGIVINHTMHGGSLSSRVSMLGKIWKISDCI